MKKDDYLRYLRDILGETLDSELTVKEIVDAFKEELTELVEYHTLKVNKAKEMLDELYGNNVDDLLDLGLYTPDESAFSSLTFSAFGAADEVKNDSVLDELDFTKAVNKLSFDTPKTINYNDEINPWDY